MPRNKNMVMVTFITDRRLKGATVPREKGVAEYLVATGQARYADVERAVTPRGETPENTSAADLTQLSREKLEELAAGKGIEVVRQDGQDKAPKKADFIAALTEG